MMLVIDTSISAAAVVMLMLLIMILHYQVNIFYFLYLYHGCIYVVYANPPPSLSPFSEIGEKGKIIEEL